MALGIVPRLKSSIINIPAVKNNEFLYKFLDSPAGPFTIHFWAPSFKWCISLANIADMQRPVEKVSTGQQIAITATGILFTRLSLVVVPVNYNLASVNVFMAGTGMIQLYRKYAAGQLLDGIVPAEEKKE
eukprot:CAMPEP_0196810690 /NCGR_PEP_ID=MMETSP1362-20130617/13239_1 /TAXON_ID=163516 /ORGANISM="Leptocylindrus danicus, Strain CCMP1856" /LENGTH=129 /DNA_ID=CAMNT_0042185795 /DNA_START=31 /DNA_END=420 /DNA_ORIENTATION=-